MFRDMGQIMKQAREMQAKLQAIQEELGRREVVGTSGGGMVTVTFDGRGEMLRVHIEPTAAADIEMLEDLVVAACRDAHRQVQDIAREQMSGLGGPFAGLLGGLPGM